MNGLRLAISFLTVLPVALHNMPHDLASARAYFPLVGLMLGGALAGIDLALQALFPSLLNGAVLVVMLIVLTGALHIEGFMDACDSLLGGYTQERRLEILHDPHIGAFAVVGGVSLLLLKWTAVVSLPVSIRAPLLVLFPCLSRWGMLIDMEVYPYA
ncbi:MAG: adenosylcobinamide-GDP ribazoletransferase, partial [Chloroflexi bacterium]|nr:adenosylcobinamide-GDP ribazoletransferase [Chloroflexota bacterium]